MVECEVHVGLRRTDPLVKERALLGLVHDWKAFLRVEAQEIGALRRAVSHRPAVRKRDVDPQGRTDMQATFAAGPCRPTEEESEEARVNSHSTT